MTQQTQTAAAVEPDPNQRITLTIAGMLYKVPLGQTGQSYERAFCSLAQQHVRGEISPFDAIAQCRQIKATMCGLCNLTQHCLFCTPNDPIWEDIRRSEQLRRN